MITKLIEKLKADYDKKCIIESNYGADSMGGGESHRIKFAVFDDDEIMLEWVTIEYFPSLQSVTVSLLDDDQLSLHKDCYDIDFFYSVVCKYINRHMTHELKEVGK